MEDVRVTWNDFEYNLKGSFAKLREDEVLYDMSLVCEGKLIPAHQVNLRCSSAGDSFKSFLRPPSLLPRGSVLQKLFIKSWL